MRFGFLTLAMKKVVVKNGIERRLRAGHAWIFSNEILSPLKEYAPGDIVTVRSTTDAFLGLGTINPRSLIAVRILSLEETAIDRSFFVDRLSRASDRRSDRRVGRMVYGESDGLPGLVIDKYDTTLVLQFLTAGMDRLQATALEAADQTWSPESVIVRNDASARKLEHLENRVELIKGRGEGEVEIEGIRYHLDFVHGQKTGFFLDQRYNHLLTAPFVKDRRVLDVFSYVGAWSLQAARGGAAEVRGIDVSKSAVEQARLHASMNDLPQCSFVHADAFDELKAINDRKELFDLVILDPPAFAKSRAEVRDALNGYREIARRGAKALYDGGVLICCSCSHVVDIESFRNVVQQGISAAGRHAWLIEQRSQAPDHPILLSMRETEYLKCLVMRVFR